MVFVLINWNRMMALVLRSLDLSLTKLPINSGEPAQALSKKTGKTLYLHLILAKQKV